jgi:hypothetical protein
MQDAGCRPSQARRSSGGGHRLAAPTTQSAVPPCRRAECRVASLSPATAGRKRKPQTPEEELRDEYDRAV